MSGESKQKIYRTIVKATGLFGGVQVIGILCSIVRNKLVAVWMGTLGVGFISLYASSMEMIGALTGLGLRSSAVRDISRDAKGDKPGGLERTVSVVRRWSWFVGLFGAVTMLSLAPYLSRWTFGNDEHMWSFVFLSCTLLFNALASGEQAVLQGLGKLKKMAQCSVIGSSAGVLLSLPLYYFFRVGGIVPSLILQSLSVAVTTFFLRNRMPDAPRMSVVETARAGREMVSLGIFMTVSGFITTLFSYLFVVWLQHTDGKEAVGLYQAGFTLVTKYVGLVFTAMGMEYYPRLSAVADRKEEVSNYVSLQAETSLLILLPIICVFILCREWVIQLLYTAEFMAIDRYVAWAMIGVLFRAVSWSIGFILLAKGAGKYFLITEFLSDSANLLLNIAGYSWFGLSGIGMAYLAGFVFYLAVIYAVCRKAYGLRIGRMTPLLLMGSTVVCGVVFAATVYGFYWIAAAVTVLAVGISLWMLKQRFFA